APDRLYPDQGDRGSDDDRDGLETGDFANGFFDAREMEGTDLLRVPVSGIFAEVALDKRKDHRDGGELQNDLQQKVREDVGEVNGLSAEVERGKDDREDEKGEAEVERQHADIEGEKHGTNPLAAESQAAVLLLIRRRYLERITPATQKIDLFLVGE